MRKLQHLTLFLLFAFAIGGEVFSQTVVNQDITTNTTWTTAGSPYLIESDILIASSAELTIEPGVEVQGDDIELSVAGSLVALGTQEDSIHFRFTGPSSGSFTVMFRSQSEAQFRFAQFQDETELDLFGGVASCQIARSTFTRNSVGIRNTTGQLPVFGSLESCAFIDNTIGIIGTNFNIRHCNFNGNETGITSFNGAIRFSNFSKNDLAVSNSAGSITDCSFFLNGIALLGTPQLASDSVLRNEIFLNDTAFSGFFSAGVIRENNICQNTIAIELLGSQDADFTGNCFCVQGNITSVVDALIIDDDENSALGTVFFEPQGNCPFSDVVWPGDADNNGLVEIQDVLQVGIAQNRQGPGRPNMSQVWTPQAAIAWNSSSAGINDLFADCDGNGVIDANDLSPIADNFGETQQKTGGLAADGIPLCLVYPDSVSAGETIQVAVYLGDSLVPVPNAYGFALVLSYDAQVVDSTQVQPVIGGTWLGTPGQDLLNFGIQQTNFHWAISRDDNIDIVGFGLVGGVEMVMIDDLAKTEALTVQVIDAILIDAQGNEIPVTLDQCPQKRAPTGLRLFPNPVANQMTLEWGDLEAEEVAVYGLDGRLHYRTTEVAAPQIDVDTESWNDGIYIVRVQFRNGLLTRKILILK